MTLKEFTESVLGHLESECEKHDLTDEMLLKGVCYVTVNIMSAAEAESFKTSGFKLTLEPLNQTTNPNK